MMDDIPPPMRIAIKESEKSTQHFKLGAVIAKGNRVLARGFNNRKSHPRFGSGMFRSTHAEGAAIRDAVSRGVDLKGKSIYIYRKNNLIAKPCACCEKLIKSFGISQIIYSGV
jgi:deoxycytidylate deaminase